MTTVAVVCLMKTIIVKMDYKRLPQEPELASKEGCQIWMTEKLIGEKFLRILHEPHWCPVRTSIGGSGNRKVLIELSRLFSQFRVSLKSDHCHY